MTSYRRAKREDAIKPQKKELTINIGSANDSFETLQQMCNDKSNELLKSVELGTGEEMEVIFWTGDTGFEAPELIGISKITKSATGQMSYSLDFSLTTL